MPYVFISYSRKDREFVDRLAADLRRAGVEIWRDVDSISPGEDWASEIEKGLKQADAILFISSGNSVRSQWMLQEVSYAIMQNIRVIPIIIEEAGIAGMPVFLQSIQWLDFRTNYEAALSHLVVALLPESVRRKHPLQQQFPKSKGYVFISYAEEDSDFASRLRSFLEERGYAYWDYQQSDRNRQVHLSAEIESIIRDGEAVISVLSPDWKRSGWARDEYDFAREINKPIFPLMVRQMESTLGVTNRPYIDFLRDQKKGFTELDKELRREGLID